MVYNGIEDLKNLGLNDLSSLYKECVCMNENYMDETLPIEERVEDLLSKMTLAEKLTQMLHSSSSVERLGIKEYNWWNECLHGVARAGVATVFPQAIGLSAMFDEDFMYEVATAISDEARAKYHEFNRFGDNGIYKGLTFWSPNINIFRDPRWGRGHETYGEDPYLTSRKGIAFVKGLQGKDEKYKKLDATIKHFAVHSGPEGKRHEFDAKVDEKDLRETYLYAFRECVRETDVSAVMGAYNRTNGEPCCGSKTLLEDILRDEWKFEGYVVSDCGAICDFHNHHKITENAAQSAAMAVNNGCDLNCGDAFRYLAAAVAAGYIKEEKINESVRRLLKARFKLGMFDAEKNVPYSSISPEVIDCDEHRSLALEAARKSIVLLKNEGNVLPLSNSIKSIAVIGPNAASKDVLLGNYNGTPSKYVTVLEGIRNSISSTTKLYYAEGCDLTKTKYNPWAENPTSEAVIQAAKADAVIMCLGLSPRIEGEEGDAFNSDASGDRLNIELPGLQQELLERIKALGKPVILVLLNGSAVAIEWAKNNVDAIIEAWYPGEEGGNAVADVLFGNYNPSGRLPVTFVKSTEDLPAFEDYSMRNRTYRYMEKEPLYPFGFGSSYTEFKFNNLKIENPCINYGEAVKLKVDVQNIGSRDGEEVVQIYLKKLNSANRTPNYQLAGFKRIKINKGETKTIEFTITPRQLAIIDDNGKCVYEPGNFTIYAGGTQPDPVSRELSRSNIIEGILELQGELREVEY
jgi:beta-glucosidase